MNFESYDFSTMNEADVREEIIAPLLRQIGYRTGTTANIVREHSLQYPKIFLGRKNIKRDPILRGRADYICEVDDSVRWVIEAKAPQSDISSDDIEQAYTYANHPEIRAVYFCLVNGLKLKIYQTNQGPNSPPLLDIKYEELAGSLRKFSNLVAPDAIRRDFPCVETDAGLPLGKGLRSTAIVTSGIVSFNSGKSDTSYQILNEMTLMLSGSIKRDENQRIVADLRSTSPFRSMNEIEASSSLDRFTMITENAELSSDPSEPSVLTEVTSGTWPAGEILFDPYRWKPVRLPQSVTYRTETKAEGTLTGKVFYGNFYVKYQFINVHQVIDAKGQFEIHLL